MSPLRCSLEEVSFEQGAGTSDGEVGCQAASRLSEEEKDSELCQDPVSQGEKG